MCFSENATVHVDQETGLIWAEAPKPRRVKVYVVCEYPHEPADEIHKIVLVTSDEAEAEKKAQPDYVYFIEEFEVEA